MERFYGNRPILQAMRMAHDNSASVESAAAAETLLQHIVVGTDASTAVTLLAGEGFRCPPPLGQHVNCALQVSGSFGFTDWSVDLQFDDGAVLSGAKVIEVEHILIAFGLHGRTRRCEPAAPVSAPCPRRRPGSIPANGSYALPRSGSVSRWKNVMRKSTVAAVCLVAACLIAAVVVGRTVSPSYSHRYRLTVSVEVDGEVHTGIKRHRGDLAPASGFRKRCRAQLGDRGRAAFVDLGGQGAIVAGFTDRGCPVGFEERTTGCEMDCGARFRQYEQRPREARLASIERSPTTRARQHAPVHVVL